MEFDGFDWDDGNWPKCGKHGVSQEEIEAVFSAPGLVVLADPGHGGDEVRYLGIVVDRVADRATLIGFTERTLEGRRLIRPITARYMHDKEVRRHGLDRKA